MCVQPRINVVTVIRSNHNSSIGSNTTLMVIHAIPASHHKGLSTVFAQIKELKPPIEYQTYVVT